MCNNNKLNKFDYDLPYIDPYAEQPSDYFAASGAWLYSKLGSERAEITIIDLDLNRADLLLKRLERIQGVDKAIKACFRTTNEGLRKAALAELKIESEPDKEYSFIVEAFFRAQGI